MFLPPRLNGKAYEEFLRRQLPPLLRNIPRRERERIIYQHDGVPAHFSRRVRELLNERFPDRWMGQGGPITWPVRSPDLNVLDYFVWGHIKNKVEHRRHGTEAEVRAEILVAFDNA